MLLLLLSLHRYLLIISTSPPPQKKKKLAKLRFCFIKNVHEINAKPIAFQRNLPRKFFAKLAFLMIVSQRNLSRIFPRNSREIGRFFREFVSENPSKFDFFSATYQRPYVLNGLRYKSSWSGHLFLSLLPLFFLHITNNVQSWPISFKKSKRLNYIGNVKEQTKCLAI